MTKAEYEKIQREHQEHMAKIREVLKQANELLDNYYRMKKLYSRGGKVAALEGEK